MKEDNTVPIELKLHLRCSVEDLKGGAALLNATLITINKQESAMRGFLNAAKLDGYLADTTTSDLDELEDHVIKAFWARFERNIKNEKQSI